jgi:hypothetical protein
MLLLTRERNAIMICKDCQQDKPEEAFSYLPASHRFVRTCNACRKAKAAATISSMVRVCRECGKGYRPTSGNSWYCSDSCRAQHNVPLSAYVIFERDRFRCIYCGRSSIEDGIALAIDHIVPYALGGAGTPNNLVTACSNCNHSKSCYELPASVADRILAVVHARDLANGINEARQLAADGSYYQREAPERYRDRSHDTQPESLSLSDLALIAAAWQPSQFWTVNPPEHEALT